MDFEGDLGLGLRSALLARVTQVLAGHQQLCCV